MEKRVKMKLDFKERRRRLHSGCSGRRRRSSFAAYLALPSFSLTSPVAVGVPQSHGFWVEEVAALEAERCPRDVPPQEQDARQRPRRKA